MMSTSTSLALPCGHKTAFRPLTRSARRPSTRQAARASILGFQDSWKVESAPDLTGKTFMVTGASSGLGYETARWLAQKNAHVIYAGRNKDRMEKAMNDAKAEAGPHAKFDLIEFNLESLKQVKAAAEEFKSTGLPLHCLINNAGLFLPPHSKTEDGIEVQLQTNYYGHWLLTHLLLDDIKKSAPSRIVWTTSQASVGAYVDWNNLVGEKDERSDINMYAQSKLFILCTAYELNKRLAGTGVTTLSAHPGTASTDIYQKQEGTDKLTAKTQQALNPIIGQDQKRGALPLFRAAVDPELSDHGAALIGPSQLILNMGDATAEREPINSQAKDDEICARLYKETKRIIEERLGESVPEA